MFRHFLMSLMVAASLAGWAGCKSPLPPPAVENAGGIGAMGGVSSGGYHGRAATPQDVYNSTTADLNGDGFVTLDEIVAMKQAGLTDDQMIERLRATNQIYELTPAQENFLRARGVSNLVIMQMETINREQGGQLEKPSGGVASPPGNAVISVPPPQSPSTP